MWNPPITLSPEEQKIAARTQKARKFFVFLRMIRHERLDADFQTTLAQSSHPTPGGKAPVEAGVVALATLLQAYGHVGDREAVERTVMDKRWQLVLDCLGAEQPPCSQGTLFHCRLRLIQHNLDKTLLERTVALAEQTGGFGARQLRAALDSTPLCGAGRVEDTFNLLGHALRKAVGLAAKALGRAAAALMEDAGLALVGQSSLKAALDLDWGAPTARESALRLVLEEGERWKRWLEQHLSAQEPPMQAMLETIGQIVAQDTEPDPEGGPGARRIKKHVAPDRRISIEDADMRHGRKSSSNTCNGFKEHVALDLDSKVTREVVVCPPTNRSMRPSCCSLRSWRKARACSSWISTWGLWPARAWPNGPRKASTSLPAPGRKWGHCSPNLTSRWTSSTAPSPVPTARPWRWSQARTPSFQPVPVMGVRCARNVPKPGSGKVGA